MKVFVTASQKGGVGKTTIAGHLAIAASRMKHESVALIDTDPQGSLSAWWNVRTSDTPILARVDLDQLEQGLRALKGQGVTYVFIDTPPAITEAINKVVFVADLVIVPTRPSPHDLRAVAGTVDLIEAHKKPLVFVVNGASVRAKMTSEAAIALSQHGRVAPVTLHHRIDFASSMIDGRTVLEIDAGAKSSEEVKHLWDYIQKIAGR